MKALLSLILILTMSKGCDEEKVQNNIKSVEYSATSRGTNFNIKVNSKTIELRESIDSKTKKMAITQDNWKEITAMVSKIDIKNIQNIKAPSTAHQYDGAALANLTVKTNDTMYSSVTFDHGNPPTEFKAVVDKLISISKSKSEK